MDQLSSTAHDAASHDPFAFGELESAVETTESQREVWLGSQFGDDASCAFNESITLRFRGYLDVAALELALADLVQRHESVRGCFSADGREMVFYSNRAMPLVHHDLSDRSAEVAQAALDGLIAAAVTTPFDLSAGPLARFDLVRLALDDQCLMLTLHHSVCDGWSLAVLAHELGELYNARRQGAAHHLPPAPSFIRYANWERGEDTAELRAQSLDYWVKKYARGAPGLELPLDNPRPRERSFAAHRLDTPLPMPLIAQLKQAGAARGATLVSGLMAGFAAYLQRISACDDMVLGVPFAGQIAIEEPELVGHCVNIIPVYLRFPAGQTFNQLVAQVQEQMLEAFEHQHLTYGTLLQRIEVDRTPGKPPLVSVVFNLDQQNDLSQAFEGLQVEVTSNPRQFENFDINLNITLSHRAAVMECTFNTRLWRLPTMERRMAELQAFYAALLRSPDQPLADADLLLGEDRRAILESWDVSHRDYPLAASSLHGLVEKAVDRFVARTAIRIDEKSLSYGELDEAANRLAHWLLRRGVGRDVIVPIMMDRSLEMMIAINGILKAGGAYLPLDPEHPLDRIAYILEESDARLVLTQAHHRKALPDNLPVFALDGMTAELADESPARPDVVIAPEQLAYVIYTSGSTGRPKGVMIEHQAICSQIFWLDETLGLKPDDRAVQKTPYTFDVSLWELFLPLMSGSLLVLAKPGGHKETGYLIDLINRERLTHIHFVPSMLYLFLQEASKARCPTLTCVILSGEAVTKDLENRFTQAFPGVACWNLYGPTEAAVHASYWLCCQDNTHNTVPIGFPVANTRLYVVDDHLRLQPPGIPGELLIAGIQTARGYLNRPDLTEQRFIRDPFVDEYPQRAYRTGDLVRLLDDGAIEYLGRNDFQVKLRGLRIELGEIENRLQTFPDVHQSVVIVREDRAQDQRLVAYLMLRDGGQLDVAALKKHLQQTLPDYMVPQHVVVLDELPLTSSGKVDRKALPAPQVGEVSDVDLVLPSGVVEEQLLVLWRDILGLEKLGITQDFFELGGHSLLGTQMLARIRQQFGVSLGLRKLFEAPSIRQLAALIEAETRSGVRQESIEPRPAGEPAVASSQQQRVWYLEQIEPDSFAYNLPAAFRLRGSLSVIALQQAMDSLPQRHELLRARFQTGDEGLQLHFCERLPLDMTPAPLSSFGVDDIEGLKQALRQKAATPFDTTRGPLFTAQLIQLGEDDHLLFLLIHHLVFDGWSFDLLLKEICALYNAFAKGEPDPLPPLPIQYADYAWWQKSWLQSDAVQKQLDYWTRQLGGTLPVLELPLDKERPPQQPHLAGGINFRFEETLVQQLEDLGNRHGCSVFMVIIGLYTLLMYRYSRQDDILIGLPVSTRNQVDINNLLGPFVNRLVCRFRIQPDKPFAHWLADVKKTALEAFDNQDTQFETLVHTLNPPRDAARPPLVQTLLSYQDVRNRTDQMDGIQRSQIDIERMGVQTDLDVWLKRQLKGIEGGMEFPEALFHTATVESFAHALIALAEAVVRQPDTSLARLAAADAAEQQRLAAWNDTRREFTGSRNLMEAWQHVSNGRAAQLAVNGPDGDYTYAELDTRSHQLAAWLHSQGVTAGEVLGVCLTRSRDVPALLLALWRLGAVYLPIDPEHPAGRVAAMLDRAGVQRIVSQASATRALDGFAGQMLLLDSAATGDAVAPLPSVVINPDTPAYLMFTSGSTGVPKGVEVSHGALHNLLRAFLDGPGLPPDARWLAVTTLTFDISLLELLLPLLAGAQLVIASEHQCQDAQALKQLIDARQINTLQATPATWRMLLNNHWQPAPDFRAFCGGESLPRDLADDLLSGGVALWNLYGPTEACIWTTSYRVEPSAGDDLPVVSIGRPLANTACHILDAQLQPLPWGVYGELYISGAGLAAGYYRDPEQTRERFVQTAEGLRLYRTGDLVRWTRDGQLQFKQRIDNQIKLRGFRIEPEDIETQLRRHPAVQDCVVVLQELGPDDHRLTAFIVYATRQRPTHSDLRQHLRASLPAYMIPQQFSPLDALPLNVSGKVDRKALSQPVHQVVSRGLVPPGTETEKGLAALWAANLKRESISIDSQFFDIGGHSLLALKTIMDMEKGFGVRFSPQDMWTNTLEQLAARIDKQLAAQGGQTQPVPAATRDQAKGLGAWLRDKLGLGR